MKTSQEIEEPKTGGCQRILAQLEAAKNAVLQQFWDLALDHKHAFELAFNEAEALAWDTSYPQLVFPVLAEEKARGVARWIAHQRVVRSQARFCR